MEILCLPLDLTTLLEDQAQRAIDQIMEAGIPPLPNGQCAMRDCAGILRRRVYPRNKEGTYLLAPYCPVCYKRYRQTPNMMWLSLETIS